MEIGSEFAWTNSMNLDKNIFLNDKNVKNFMLTFSGRTSIDIVIRNIGDVKKVMLPSYCCDSMVEPFRKNGLEVCYYNVYYDDKLMIELNIPDDVDILMWSNYFGYKIEMPDVSHFKQKGGIVIEDITHSLLSDAVFNPQSDFLVASIRKWLPVLCGGYCASFNSILKDKPKKYPPEFFVRERKKAMKLKQEYLIDNDKKKKTAFLSIFSNTNEWLRHNYTDLMIDAESEQIISRTDFEWVKEIRTKNAKRLYEGLQNCNSVKPLFESNLMDCPLFVPVIIAEEKRNIIQKKLIDNEIYCPIHWPKPDGCNSNLYNIELSLICDQRYDEKDMQRIIDVLCNL